MDWLQLRLLLLYGRLCSWFPAVHRSIYLSIDRSCCDHGSVTHVCSGSVCVCAAHPVAHHRRLSPPRPGEGQGQRSGQVVRPLVQGRGHGGQGKAKDGSQEPDPSPRLQYFHQQQAAAIVLGHEPDRAGPARRAALAAGRLGHPVWPLQPGVFVLVGHVYRELCQARFVVARSAICVAHQSVRWISVSKC